MARPQRNTSTTAPLTPDFGPEPPTEADLLRQEITLLRHRIQCQSHALKQLNHAVRFVMNTLGKPMHIKGMDKPAKKGKFNEPK